MHTLGFPTGTLYPGIYPCTGGTAVNVPWHPGPGVHTRVPGYPGTTAGLQSTREHAPPQSMLQLNWQ
eukprot:3324815-Rhodomonas_salina.1